MLSNICVTGATGFIGSHFVREWQKRQMGAVFALVRPKGQASGQDRLFAALQVARHAAADLGDHGLFNIECIDADVRRPLCGLTTDAIERLHESTCDTFWHFASDLRFEAHQAQNLQQTNIDGASNALDLALAVGVKRFVYVSTAYVCGRSGGVIEEELPGDALQFSNGYEASKAKAEQLLFERCRTEGIALTIVRPSVVLGPRATKSLAGSETGLFSLVHALMWIRSSQGPHGDRIRIPALAQADINFIPVDCVVADMLALAESGFGDQCIYHLTSSASTTVGECWAALSQVTGLDIIDLVTPGTVEPRPLERLIMRRVGFFMSYINVERHFSRSLTPTWTINQRDVEGYVQNAVDLITHENLPASQSRSAARV